MSIPPHILSLIASHEAGHAVAMAATGQRVQYATIEPGGGMLGHVKPIAGKNATADTALVGVVAGVIAVQLLYPGGNAVIDEFRKTLPKRDVGAVKAPSDGDLARAFVVSSLVREAGFVPIDPPSPELLEERYTVAMTKAAGILLANMAALLTVRDLLLIRKRVEGNEIHRIVRSEMRSMIASETTCGEAEAIVWSKATA